MLICLQDMGSFYIGGRDVQLQGQPHNTVKRNDSVEVCVDPNGTYSIESIYVQYFLPVNYHHVIILIHGGGGTGAIWENTSTENKGWLNYLLEKGFAVYNIDMVERGRAGWCALPDIWQGEPEMRSHERSWQVFRIGAVFPKIYPNQQFPIEHFELLTKYNVPRWNCNAQKSANALHELCRKINQPSTIIAHSQGADIAMRIAGHADILLDNIILLEPSGFPDFIKDDDLSRRILFVFGDNIERSTFWTKMHDQANQYVDFLLQKKLQVKWFSLPAMGMVGNSHIMMMDKNNKKIIDELIHWINSNAEN